MPRAASKAKRTKPAQESGGDGGAEEVSSPAVANAASSSSGNDNSNNNNNNNNGHVNEVSLEEGLKRLREAYEKPPQQKILAFYSSVLGGVTKEPALFTVPVDDHQPQRGHAVFDTCNVQHGLAIGLTPHLNRLVESARRGRIEPFADVETLRRIVLDTIAASRTRDNAYVRMYMSAGRGDFHVSPRNCKGTNFFVVVHAYNEAAKAHEREHGISECIVSVPLKSKELATFKTTNYIVNALAAMEAQERGGTLGLQLDPHGNIAETSVGSVGFVGPDLVLRTPKLDFVLKSTTVVRAKELVEAHPQDAKPLMGFQYADITPSQAREAIEVVGFGGGHVSPIVTFDGKQVGDGKPGPVFRALHALLDRDAQAGSPNVDVVPYEVYE